MSQRKYMMSGGLAFAEQKDMEKLSRYSKKGWHVCDFKFMGYLLEKGQSEDFIYSVDYRTLGDGETEEYLDLFSSAGWTHVTSQANMHLFRAAPGTEPIYTDRSTAADKHDNLGKSMKWAAISMVILTALLWLGAGMSAGSVQTALIVAATIFTVISLPLGWTALTVYRNKWEVEGNKRLGRLARVIPFLLLAAAVITWLSVGKDSDNHLLLLAYILIGGLGLPTLIWAVMTLYHKLAGSKA